MAIFETGLYSELKREIWLRAEPTDRNERVYTNWKLPG